MGSCKVEVRERRISLTDQRVGRKAQNKWSQRWKTENLGGLAFTLTDERTLALKRNKWKTEDLNRQI